MSGGALIGVAYNPLTGIALWHDITTTAQEDANLQAGLTVAGTPIPQGIAIAVIPAAQVGQPNLDNIIPVVQSVHNVALIRAPRCAVIDLAQQTTSGSGPSAIVGHPVVAMILADTTMFSLPNKMIVESQSADVGYIYNPATKAIVAPVKAVSAQA